MYLTDGINNIRNHRRACIAHVKKKKVSLINNFYQLNTVVITVHYIFHKQIKWCNIHILLKLFLSNTSQQQGNLDLVISKNKYKNYIHIYLHFVTGIKTFNQTSLPMYYKCFQWWYYNMESNPLDFITLVPMTRKYFLLW